MKDNLAVYREYLSAYNAKNVDQMLALFAENCVFENISGGRSTVRTEGKAALESLARRSTEVFALREQKVISITSGPERLVVEIEFHGLLKADLTSELRAGSCLDLRGVSVVEFRRGQIVRLTDYS